MSTTKRRLAGSVLIFESIVIALAVPVAVNVAHAPTAHAWGLGLALATACVVVAARVDRPWGTAAGWLIQALMLVTAFAVPMMVVLGALFTGLWCAALVLAAGADAGAFATVADNGSTAERSTEGQ